MDDGNSGSLRMTHAFPPRRRYRISNPRGLRREQARPYEVVVANGRVVDPPSQGSTPFTMLESETGQSRSCPSRRSKASA